ncbi:MAG: hypothetical protein AB1941_12495 [Gemmatimonadota bacterium]
MSKRRSPGVPAFPFAFLGGDVAPADAVVAEELPGATATALRQLLHEVRIWLSAPGPERKVIGEAPETAPLPHGLAHRVARAFELLREEPDADTEGAIALALAWAANWMEAEGRALRSAVVFYQTTLLILPASVPVAYHIGRLLRRLAMYEAAEAWLLHSIEKAATAGDWQHHALALSGMGNLMRERGAFPDAIRFHRLALKSAREHGVRRLEGDASYDLAVMCFERGELAEGMEHARGAMKAYGPGHGQLVRMANDLAWIWMHLHGEAGLSLMLFQAIEPRVQNPPFRAVLLANIARAAAEIGEEDIYEAAWLEAYGYMRKQDTEDGHAAALGQMALASVASMHLERARQAARLSLDIAQRRQESRLVHVAEKILAAIEEGLPEPRVMKELFPAFELVETEADATESERSEDFVSALGQALRAREDGGPESPVRALVRGR